MFDASFAVPGDAGVVGPEVGVPDGRDPELGAVVEDAQVAAPNLDRLVVLEPKHLGKRSALGLQSDTRYELQKRPLDGNAWPD